MSDLGQGPGKGQRVKVVKVDSGGRGIQCHLEKKWIIFLLLHFIFKGLHEKKWVASLWWQRKEHQIQVPELQLSAILHKALLVWISVFLPEIISDRSCLLSVCCLVNNVEEMKTLSLSRNGLRHDWMHIKYCSPINLLKLDWGSFSVFSFRNLWRKSYLLLVWLLCKSSGDIIVANIFWKDACHHCCEEFKHTYPFMGQ